MKKTFSLTAPNKAPARQVDSVKHDIKKYIAREKRNLFQEKAGTGILTVELEIPRRMLSRYL